MEKYRVAVIGSGPAGYTAALYTARARLEPLVMTGIKSGGQLMNTTVVENYPGFPEGVKGPELMMHMRQQAEHFGAKMVDVFATAVDFSVRPFKIWTWFPPGPTAEEAVTQKSPEEFAQLLVQVKEQAHAYEADSVIVATGATAILLGVPGETDFLGRGVSTCAVCDAAFFKDKNVFVVGGGDSAMEDSLALTKFATSLTIVHRRDAFKASKIMQERVLHSEKIKVMWNSTLTAVLGDQKVTGVKINENGTEKELPADGVFIAIGHNPMTNIFKDQLQLDNHGFIVTRQSVTKAGVDAATGALSAEGLVSFPSMTSVAGVFAAGDVVDIRYWQAVTAAGQGCAAAIDAERWIESQ